MEFRNDYNAALSTLPGRSIMAITKPSNLIILEKIVLLIKIYLDRIHVWSVFHAMCQPHYGTSEPISGQAHVV